MPHPIPSNVANNCYMIVTKLITSISSIQYSPLKYDHVVRVKKGFGNCHSSRICHFKKKEL